MSASSASQPSVVSIGRYPDRDPATAPPAAIGACWPPSPPSLTRFEPVAGDNENLPAPLGDMAGLLLQTVCTRQDGWRPVLQPLWAEEGMHRAYALLRLLDRRHGAAGARLETANDHLLARKLANGYRSLTETGENAIVPCSQILRELARNLVALLGTRPAIVLHTEIERISLPAYRRRALILCASELLLNALTHAFHASSRNARLLLSLQQLGRGHICLHVADNGVGFALGVPKPRSSIAGGLAELLETSLQYRRTADGATVAELVLPVASGLS